MKKVRKNKIAVDFDGISAKLASYTAMAGAVLSTSPDASAQCTQLPQTPGQNLVTEVDINGDGIVDLTFNNLSSSFAFGFQNSFGSILFTFNQVYTTSVAYAVFNNAGTFSYQNANGAVAVSIPFPGAGPGFNQTTFGPSFIGSNQNIPDGFVGSYSANTINGCAVSFPQQPFYYFQVYSFSAIFQYVNGFIAGGAFNGAYAQAAGGNQIVGLSSGGADICAVVTTNIVSLGAAITSYTDFLSSLITYQWFPFVSNNFYAPFGATVTYDTCGIYTGQFGGIFGSSFSTVVAENTITDGIPPVTGGQTNNNPTQFIGVEFAGPDQDGDGNPDTYYGWVEITIDPATSEITCVNSDFNPCSVEAAAQATAGAAAAGDTTFNGDGVTDPCLAAGASGADVNPDGCVYAVAAVCPDISALSVDATEYCFDGMITATVTLSGPAEGGEVITVGGVASAALVAGANTVEIMIPVAHSGGCASESQSIGIDSALCSDGTDIAIDAAVVPIDVTIYPALTETITLPDCVGSAGAAILTAADGTECENITGTTGVSNLCPDTNHTDATLSYDFTAYNDPLGCFTGTSNNIMVDCAVNCGPLDEVPTVGEWGLIMLGLMMSITAVVGIRQRREEEVTA